MHKPFLLCCVFLVACTTCEARTCSTDHSLLDTNRTALVVIDVLQNFLTKLPLDQRNAMVDHIAWLMRVARALPRLRASIG